jgi:hypothetical protein
MSTDNIVTIDTSLVVHSAVVYGHIKNNRLKINELVDEMNNVMYATTISVILVASVVIWISIVCWGVLVYHIHHSTDHFLPTTLHNHS